MSSLKLHLIRITQLYRMLIYANLEKQKLSTSRIYSESIKQVKLSRADGDRERGRETRLPTPPASLPTNTTSRCESFACKRKSSRGGNNTLLVNTNKCQAQNRWSKKKKSRFERGAVQKYLAVDFHFIFSSVFVQTRSSFTLFTLRQRNQSPKV